MFETGGKVLAVRSCQKDVKKLSKTFLGGKGKVHSCTVKLK